MSVNIEGMTREELQAYVKQLESNATKVTSDGVGIKIGSKGGVSVYGLGRFPVTLYTSQWERLFAHTDVIRQFIVDNADKLAVKPAKS